MLRTVGGNPLGVATNLAYPLGDLVLLGRGRRRLRAARLARDRTWALLGLGIVLFWLADSLTSCTVANETLRLPGLFDAGWTSCLVLFAAAAWQPARRSAPAEDAGAMRFIAVPLAFGGSAWASSSSPRWRTLNPLAVVLAAASLLAVMARLMLTFRENAGDAATSRATRR